MRFFFLFGITITHVSSCVFSLRSPIAPVAQDLVQLCVDYMLKHISKAATQGYMVSWLHYTISFSPYHQEVTDALQRFLKWNLDIVAESRDFVDLDVNILIGLLQQNDLVLQQEFDLFK